MKTKNKQSESLEAYREEVQLQIENILVGKPVTDKLSAVAERCKKDLDAVPKNVKDTIKSTLTIKGLTQTEVDDTIADCERALKLRQAIKICTENGLVYWMWKLQPGEEIPDGHKVV